MKIQSVTYLSLGTNQGDKLENLQKAINFISEVAGSVQKISSIYKTASWGFAGEDFYNICIQLSTSLTADELLKTVLNIETKLGRERTTSSEYQNRNIDIDVLLFDDEIIFSKTLIIPHTKMLERKFVMVPLVEIAPNAIHPIQQKELQICLQSCADSSEIAIVDKTLTRPIILSEKYNYIAIEGNIGAGKTSLAKMISEDFNAKLVLERFADNPFLPHPR